MPPAPEPTPPVPEPVPSTLEPRSTATAFTPTSPHRARWDDESLDHTADFGAAADRNPDPSPPAWLSEPTGPLSLWHERLVPERFRGTRWDPGPRGVLVLAAVAAIVIALTATMTMRDRPTVHAVPPITPAMSTVSGTEGPAGADNPVPRPGDPSTSVPGDASFPAPADAAAGTPRSPGSRQSGPAAATPPAASAAAGPAAPGGAPSARTPMPEIVISVVGVVEHGGLLRFPPGARIADALKAATPKPEADLSGLNLAQPLCDGDQIVIGRTGSRPTVQQVGSTIVNGPAPTPPSTRASQPAQPRPSTPTAKVNLNTATESDLDALPGVGPITAKAILAWRTKHGRFTSIDQLSEIDGIGPTRLARLKSVVTI
ncbi:helix-hairpin-helix domain-containing protein [Nocardia yamanashiensis]|uniref:helix-hairpin-helix domain-containing protein n=1 Tax=Nocardia yamanashiensis TaxID=209247 RepID=UPI000B1E2AD4|nr:helix-hairpin-helix domain-containing protein [Nocardia yamanashiensis]